MQERKLKIGFARFPYAGNGQTQSEDPNIGDWLVKTTLKIKADSRCEEGIWPFREADTPITMVRNLALKSAVAAGVDVLVMIDSDQIPDLHLGTDPDAKPFWDTSFEFLWNYWDKGPCCIGAPYCGGFPHPVTGGNTNVFTFQWSTDQNDPTERQWSLQQITREEAARRAGMEEIAALPTGLYMIDTRVAKIVPAPWFYYEWKDPPYNTEKVSTEDVVFTRNASLLGVPQFCNWDAWAGHVKPQISGKPLLITKDQVRGSLREAWERGMNRDDCQVEIQAGVETSEVLRELEREKVRPAPRETTNRLSPTDAARTDKDKFRVVNRKYGVDLCEVTEQGVLVANTGDAEVETLRDLVKVLVGENPDRPLEILEIGTWAGHTACALHDALGPQGGTVWCVDTWKGGPGDTCERNAQLYGSENVKALFDQNCEGHAIGWMQMTSKEAASHPDLPRLFDLIFIDADKNAIKLDLDLWVPRVREGGIFCGHDYDVAMFPGVVAEVEKRFPEGRTEGRVWWQGIGPPGPAAPPATQSDPEPRSSSEPPSESESDIPTPSECVGLDSDSIDVGSMREMLDDKVETPATQSDPDPVADCPPVLPPILQAPEPIPQEIESIQDRLTPGERGSLELRMRRGETLSMMMTRLQGEIEGGHIAEGQAVVIKQPEATAV